MVAINLSDMGYSHVHPIEITKDASTTTQSTSFMAHFITAGIYRIFIQVQVAGEIYTLPLSIEIEKDTMPTTTHTD